MQVQEIEIQNTKQTILSCSEKAFLFNLQVTTTIRLDSGHETCDQCMLNQSMQISRMSLSFFLLIFINAPATKYDKHG